jgi:hypothetical protein
MTYMSSHLRAPTQTVMGWQTCCANERPCLPVSDEEGVRRASRRQRMEIGHAPINAEPTQELHAQLLAAGLPMEGSACWQTMRAAATTSGSGGGGGRVGAPSSARQFQDHWFATVRLDRIDPVARPRRAGCSLGSSLAWTSEVSHTHQTGRTPALPLYLPILPGLSPPRGRRFLRPSSRHWPEPNPATSGLVDRTPRRANEHH